MSRSVELSNEDYERLEQAAAAEGMTPAEWIEWRLSPRSRIISNANGKSDKSLAERFAGRIGVINSGGKERLSERHREVFGEILEEKRKAGRL